MIRPSRRAIKANPGECAEVRELLTDYLDDDLGRRPTRRVERHVGSCSRCQQVLVNLRRTVIGLRFLREERAPDGVDPIGARARTSRLNGVSE